jgi:hypothetical protein
LSQRCYRCENLLGLGGVDFRLIAVSVLPYLANEVIRFRGRGVAGNWAQIAQDRLFDRSFAFSDKVSLIRIRVVLRCLFLLRTSSDFLRGGSGGMGQEVYEVAPLLF